MQISSLVDELSMAIFRRGRKLFAEIKLLNKRYYSASLESCELRVMSRLKLEALLQISLLIPTERILWIKSSPMPDKQASSGTGVRIDLFKTSGAVVVLQGAGRSWGWRFCRHLAFFDHFDTGN